MAGFYAVALFITGIILPFFPVLLSAKGLSGGEIGFVLATPQIMRMMIMPVLSGLSDRARDRRTIMLLLVALGLAATLAFGFVDGRNAIIVTAAFLLVLSYSISPLADALALLIERNGLGDYGRMRLWGSASFVVGNLVGGFALEHAGTGAVYWLLVASFAVTLAAARLLPRPTGTRPQPTAAATIPDQTSNVAGDALSILRRPAFLAVLLGHAVNQASHATYYGFGTLTWQDRGFSDISIGILWAIGVLAEITLFAFAGRLPRTISPLRLIMIGSVIGVVRWILYAIELPLLPTAMLQVMHGGSFGLAHIGFIRFLSDRVPDRRAASAQAVFVIFNGLAMAVATALSGRLWPAIGDTCYLVMSVFSLAGLLILILSRPGVRHLPELSRECTTAR